ncbi:hypothetical protein SUVZ_12G3500 [Saccharomyces uvarum]|uniref:Pre-mRNA-splicing factor CWC24 n=1 Tax=Saccharomyces uvarum TaxID=230603 RepID=A0ABN8WP01_SACUV|nr:hypothetical protein SUVZ_12G3500 [Saccharomyces uvarum]
MFRKRVVKKSPVNETGQKKRQKIDFSNEKPVASDRDDDFIGSISSAKAERAKRLRPSDADEHSISRRNENLDKYTLTVNDDSTKEDLLNSERRELAEKVRKEHSNDSIELALNMSGKKARLAKQINQPSNIRTTLLMDFQPDVCKDFKQTGFCGYGDSCKFLHSRDDFKTGWKLNQEWNVDNEDSRKNALDLDKIPFKCVICKENYKSPVVTSCGHYFCGPCFATEMKKGTKCFICGKETHGSAKVAADLQKILGRRKA